MKINNWIRLWLFKQLGYTKASIESSCKMSRHSWNGFPNMKTIRSCVTSEADSGNLSVWRLQSTMGSLWQLALEPKNGIHTVSLFSRRKTLATSLSNWLSTQAAGPTALIQSVCRDARKCKTFPQITPLKVDASNASSPGSRGRTFSPCVSPLTWKRRLFLPAVYAVKFYFIWFIFVSSVLEQLEELR